MTTYRETGITYREAGFPYRGRRELAITTFDFTITALPVALAGGGIAVAVPTLSAAITARPLMIVGSPPPTDITISALSLGIDATAEVNLTLAEITHTVVAPTVVLGAVSRNVPTLPIQITVIPPAIDQTINPSLAVYTVEIVAPVSAQTLPVAPATFTAETVAPTVALGGLTTTTPTIDIDISALQTGFDGAANVAVPTLNIVISALPYVFIPAVDIDISAVPFAAVTNVGGAADQTEDLPTVTITISVVGFATDNATDADAVFECVDTWPANQIIGTCECHLVVETDRATRMLTTVR